MYSWNCPFCDQPCATGPYGPRLTCGSTFCEAALAKTIADKRQVTRHLTSGASQAAIRRINEPQTRLTGEENLTRRTRLLRG